MAQPRKLETIQKQNKLNQVFAIDEPNPTNKGHHQYLVVIGQNYTENSQKLSVQFQNGPRKELDSKPGVLDVDLLEIVRDRLKSFQSGPYACRENAIALTDIEDALLWLNKRVEDRAASNKLGTKEI